MIMARNCFTNSKIDNLPMQAKQHKPLSCWHCSGQQNIWWVLKWWYWSLHKSIYLRCGGQSRPGQGVVQQQHGSTPLELLPSVPQTLFLKFKLESLILFSNYNKSVVDFNWSRLFTFLLIFDICIKAIKATWSKVFSLHLSKMLVLLLKSYSYMASTFKWVDSLSKQSLGTAVILAYNYMCAAMIAATLLSPSLGVDRSWAPAYTLNQLTPYTSLHHELWL